MLCGVEDEQLELRCMYLYHSRFRKASRGEGCGGAALGVISSRAIDGRGWAKRTEWHGVHGLSMGLRACSFRLISGFGRSRPLLQDGPLRPVAKEKRDRSRSPVTWLKSLVPEVPGF